MTRISTLMAAGGLLLAATSALAQTTTVPPTTTGPGTGTGSSAISPQGLPPSTPQDFTGRSPGQLSDQITVPSLRSSPGINPDGIPDTALPPSGVDSGG